MFESIVFVAACIAAVVLLGFGINSVLKKIEEINDDENIIQ